MINGRITIADELLNATEMLERLYDYQTGKTFVRVTAEELLSQIILNRNAIEAYLKETEPAGR